NRVTIPERNEKAAAGGLAVALREALEKQGGLWFGWSGSVKETTTTPTIVERGNVTYAVTDLTEAERQSYYLGFSNRALWPLMHYRLGLTEFSRVDYAGYLAVNRRFAKALMSLLKPDDIIWIHDYHLIPLAAELRRRGLTNRIGYFHHIPWPPAEMFGALPFAATLASTVMAYDLVGLQTATDVSNLIGCLSAMSGARSDGRKVRVGRRETIIQPFPIGIDVEAFRKLAAASVRSATTPLKTTRQSLGERKLVIGVDRLDYSKGIVQRLEAFGHFLRSHPDQRGRVGLLQIAPPSRSDVPEYAELDRQSDEVAGRLNAALGEFDWTPIRVVKKAYSRNALAGFYRRAQVGLVTPMRDGMNLVAKEYVAAQDPADPGVLVLSRFAGAAHQMGEALIVNPYDLHEVAEAIRTALAMPISERIRRFERLYARIEATDIGWWTQRYLDALSGIDMTPSDILSPKDEPSTAAKARRPAKPAAKKDLPKTKRSKTTGSKTMRPQAAAGDDTSARAAGQGRRLRPKAAAAPAPPRPSPPSG
ncbi:MAG: trehalose-6-phosphate synthase, partial [Bosea sp. (in: a-proteobacteria)]|nr:trehalose-6-phosphate synthase [Bosea sp. (in: a-proteobacteria)]